MERNELCYEIEKLPASEQQTKVSLLACEMVNKMEEMEKKLWATREELYEKKQRLDILSRRLEIRVGGEEGVTDRIDILEMHIQNLEFELRQAKKETDEHRQLYLKSICYNAIMEDAKKLCDIIVNSKPDTKIEGDIEGLALHISHWFTVSKMLLYTQQDLDAAVLAERERCAAVCRELRENYGTAYQSFVEGWQSALDLAEQKIKEGK